MAKVKSLPPPIPVASKDLAKKVKSVLIKDLLVAGIHPKIGISPVPGTKLIRVNVIADEFSKLRPSERQDLVWRILSAVLTHDQQIRISMVLTLTRDELAGSFSL
jgi:hypothetical protein